MKNVQLLVISKEGLLCGVGEVGEIYVRSSGLAEGYLKLDDITAEKFITNPFTTGSKKNEETSLPFYKGARDRMYKSGDLGRYRADGMVECTGRSDDQIKLRGFRIELGDIDTPLSQHPKVRENVTLLRRNKDEEMMLVTYFVPLLGSSGSKEEDDMEDLVWEIKEYLKLKLPAYAVPSVFVPLIRMPLTPNGKVDKNSLPFPDTALTGTSRSQKSNNDTETTKLPLTTFEESIRSIWSKLLNQKEANIPITVNFFDIGGHSILATRLVFEIRKTFAVDVPLGIVYKATNIQGMGREIEKLLGLGVSGGMAIEIKNDEDGIEGQTKRKLKISKSVEDIELKKEKFVEKEEVFDYASDLQVVLDELDLTKIPEFKFLDLENHESNFFVTGATGFLGAFIIEKLLKKYPKSKAIVLVRGKTQQESYNRMKENGIRHLVWDQTWETEKRISVITGDLGLPKFGMKEDEWDELSSSVDVIIHNGALVHWIYPYHKLRNANVLGTLEAIKLSINKKHKAIHFVSSTSVLDTEHYVRMMDTPSMATNATAPSVPMIHKTSNSGGVGGGVTGGRKVLETDDLEGARKGLGSGYGQTKWVAEKLMMSVMAKGVKGSIIRPGYIVGDSQTGVGNTDDFLWRLVKGCIQLGKVPKISNIVNMCPVDYVASSVISVLSSPENFGQVYHMWNPHRFRFDDLFGHIKVIYPHIVITDYIEWRSSLMELTLSSGDHALYPLLHFVLDDLPTSTKSPELGDENIKRAIDHSGGADCPNIKGDLMNLYLGYLCAVGFLENPGNGEVKLPQLESWDGIKGNLVARSGN